MLTDFDPLQILQDLGDNQVLLNQNQIKHAKAIDQLIQRVNEQQKIIDTLAQGLEHSNRANELMLAALAQDIHRAVLNMEPKK